MKKSLLFFICFALAACSQSIESKLESNARVLQTCLVHQVFPDECDEPKYVLETSELQAIQQGIAQSVIDASKKLGQLSVQGNPTNSPYSRVKKSVSRSPFYLSAVDANYAVYARQCPEFEEVTLDMLNEWPAPPEAMYKVLGHQVKDKALLVVAVAKQFLCRPADYTEISTEFPILSHSQLDDLVQAAQRQELLFAGYNRVLIKRFESLEEVEAFKQRNSGNEGSTLTVPELKEAIKLAEEFGSQEEINQLRGMLDAQTTPTASQE